MNATTLPRPLGPRALVLGALGGAALILVSALSTRGPLILVPYAALVAALGALLARFRAETFRTRFVAALGSFLIATAILWLYIDLVANPHWPHLADVWRLGILVAIGALLSAAVTYVTD